MQAMYIYIMHHLESDVSKCNRFVASTSFTLMRLHSDRDSGDPLPCCSLVLLVLLVLQETTTPARLSLP